MAIFNSYVSLPEGSLMCSIKQHGFAKAKATVVKDFGETCSHENSAKAKHMKTLIRESSATANFRRMDVDTPRKCRERDGKREEGLEQNS